jgi:hypothetical protein
MQYAMNRSSPIPEPVLGKRAWQVDEPQDGDDTDQDEEHPSAIQAQSVTPSISNITAATLRYAAKKRLRPEQRDEVEAFLLVNTSLVHISWVLLNIGQDTPLGRQAKLFACLLSVETKVDAFRSAAPPFQLSEELKVCMAIFSYTA